MSIHITFIDGDPVHCPNLESYWRDPRPFEAERRAGQAQIDRLFQQHDARRLAERERIWAMIEGEKQP